MAVGLKELPHLYAVNGMRLATACAGIKQAERDDVALIEICAGAKVAAVFTRNAFCAAPVTVARSIRRRTDAAPSDSAAAARCHRQRCIARLLLRRPIAAYHRHHRNSNANRL